MLATTSIVRYNWAMEVIIMDLSDSWGEIRLFDGIRESDRVPMLGCIGYHEERFSKGEVVALEGENLKHIGIILSGCVDMIKEDLWGNKTMLLRLRKNELFGETFACGDDSMAVVTFLVSEDARILFLPFNRVMHSCTMACAFHHRLIENMVRIIAGKNRDLMQKVEVVSKRTIREKILAYLSLQAQRQRSRYFEIPLGRLELADYLNVDRSSLMREIRGMKREGILWSKGRKFRFIDN